MTTHVWRTLGQSTADIRLLWFSVFVRMISFGLTNQVLTLYLIELGVSEKRVGLFMSLTMIGDSAISYYLTWNATKIGYRAIMLLGSFLMVLASGVFATGTSNFSILLAAAIVGVISPSGGETGPFKTIEETVLANLTPPNHRPEVYAVHSVLGSLGAALGSFIAGVLVDHLTVSRGYTHLKAYQYAFLALTITSTIKLISLLFVSSRVEPDHVVKITTQDTSTTTTTTGNTHSAPGGERQPLLRISSEVEHTTITGLSTTTQTTLFKLLVPFMLDSFGWGFMTNAWVVYYFAKRYAVTAAALGMLFAITAVATSIAAFPSAWFAKRFGPITASITTQIPCALFFAAIPILGKTYPIAATLYLFNQLTTAFDVVPRQIILTSLIGPAELPKVLGSVNIGKQIARSISPLFTGYFAAVDALWACFILSGAFLALANVILALDFKDLDAKVKIAESVDHDIV